MSSLEEKREQFRRYLERCGVIDALSRAMIRLYEEPNKPDDAIRFIRKYMCESCPDDAQYDMLKADYEETTKQLIKVEQDFERLKMKVKLTPEEVAALVEEAWKGLVEDNDYDKSLLRKHLTREVMDELKAQITPGGANFLDCARSGLEHHDSAVGAYAADFESYDVYRSLFDPIISDYHGVEDASVEQFQVPTDFGNLDEIANLDPERKYIVSTRIRIARNLAGLPYFPKLTEEQFMEIEEKVKAAVEALDGEHAGNYYSMKDLDMETQTEMVNRRILFKRGDEFLQTAGCYRFWPTGRGIFHNPAETFLVWINEEDHLRIISMVKCGDLGDVYTRLANGLKALESTLTFAHHDRYGNVTSCPSNLGTTLRASVHIKLPNLSKDPERLQELATQLNLQIRGTGGEHTAVEDGIMDISNKRRLGFTEFELVKLLQDGISELLKAEEEAEP